MKRKEAVSRDVFSRADGEMVCRRKHICTGDSFFLD